MSCVICGGMCHVQGLTGRIFPSRDGIGTGLDCSPGIGTGSGRDCSAGQSCSVRSSAVQCYELQSNSLRNLLKNISRCG